MTEWDRELGDKDICWGRIQNLDEVLHDPLFRERKMVLEVKDKAGNDTLALGVPVKLSDTPGSVRTPPDAFGESTSDILQDLGYSKEEIKELLDKKII